MTLAPAVAAPSESSPPGRLGRLLRVATLFSLPLVAYLIGIPFCPSAALLRLPCPGCGLTRASVALLQADFGAAFALNPLAVVVCPVMAVAVLWSAANYVRKGSGHIPNWMVWGVVAAFVALNLVWGARMAFGFFGGPVAV